MKAQIKLLIGLLDAVDGHAARLLGQSSKFGAMLDMLTDRYTNIELPSFSAVQGHCGSNLNEFCFRCATMCLLTTLSTFYPSFMFLFQVKF